jgi:hypothetical protein
MKKDARKIGVWGGTGSGKSTRVKEIIKNNNRVIVIDPIGDYEQEKGFKCYKTLKGLYQAIKKGWNTGFKAVLVVQRGKNPQAMLEELAEGLFKIQEPYYQGKEKRILTLVVEEMSICYPERTLGQNERSFLELVNLGRHYGIEIIGVSQRIAEVKKNFVGNCSEHFFFRLGSASDRNAVTGIIGPEHKKELISLGAHEYLHFAFGKVSKGKNKCDWKR